MAVVVQVELFDNMAMCCFCQSKMLHLFIQAMFSEAEAHELQIPHYVSAAATARHSVYSAYRSLFGGSSSSNCSSSSHPLVAAVDDLAHNVSFSDFLWAHSCVSSREFGVGPYRLLVPFADMANHDPAQVCTFSYENKHTLYKQTTRIFGGHCTQFECMKSSKWLGNRLIGRVRHAQII